MRLPLTIRSRCQQLRFDGSGDDLAERWLAERYQGEIPTRFLLALGNGGAQRALQLATSGQFDQRCQLLEGLEELQRGRGDPVAVADQWIKAGAESSLHWLIKLLEDLIEVRVTAAASRLVNRDLVDRLRRLAERSKPTDLFAALDRLRGYRRLLETGSGLAALNLFEEFTIKWARTGMGRGID
jgi:DNA polymerase-3 subunit delta'